MKKLGRPRIYATPEAAQAAEAYHQKRRRDYFRERGRCPTCGGVRDGATLTCSGCRQASKASRERYHPKVAA